MYRHRCDPRRHTVSRHVQRNRFSISQETRHLGSKGSPERFRLPSDNAGQLHTYKASAVQETTSDNNKPFQVGHDATTLVCRDIFITTHANEEIYVWECELCLSKVQSMTSVLRVRDTRGQVGLIRTKSERDRIPLVHISAKYGAGSRAVSPSA